MSIKIDTHAGNQLIFFPRIVWNISVLIYSKNYFDFLYEATIFPEHVSLVKMIRDFDFEWLNLGCFIRSSISLIKLSCGRVIFIEDITCYTGTIV